VPIDAVKIRDHIALYGAVSLLQLIGAEWYTPSWADKDIDPLRTPKAIIGGHQTLTKGWVDADENTLRNSWSNVWGNDGEANYSFSVWRPYILEGWTIAEIPADLLSFLAELPAPADFHYQWSVDLHQGAENEPTKWLQVALMILGYLAPIPAAQMGVYGPKTAAAVGAYQRANGISPVPESCGPRTRAALNAQFAL
jgi:hypothetical protein